MRNPTELQKQQYERFKALFALSRQRYLEAGGDPRKCPSGRKGDDYLTDEERQELFDLGRQIFPIQTINNEGASGKVFVKDAKN